RPVLYRTSSAEPSRFFARARDSVEVEYASPRRTSGNHIQQARFRMTAREAILGTLAAALIWAPLAGRQNSQTANPRDRALASALAARDRAQAIRLATEALSTPLSLPAGH